MDRADDGPSWDLGLWPAKPLRSGEGKAMSFSPPYFWSGHLETEAQVKSRSPGLENRATPEGTVPGIPQHKLKEEAEAVVGLGRVGRTAMQNQGTWFWVPSLSS